MAKFRVQIQQFVQELAEVVIEAETAEQAQDIVRGRLEHYEDDLDWQDGHDSISPEVIGAESV